MISFAFCQISDNFPRLKAQGNYKNFENMCEIIPNFTSIPFDYPDLFVVFGHLAL